jgi:hypothetical protein
MTGERGRLAGDPLHHVAVAADGINVVVEYRVTRPIEMLRQPAAGHRHAYAVATALAERSGRGLDARSQAIFGMAGTFAAELSKTPDIVERDRGLVEPLFLICNTYPAQMQHRVQQHRGVSVGQDEAIPIRPERIIWVKAHKTLPKRIHQRSQRHWRAGVAGIGLLDGIDR